MNIPLDPFTFPIKIETDEQYIFAVKLLEYTKDKSFGYIFRPTLLKRGWTGEQLDALITLSKIELAQAIEDYEKRI